jgi:hypothetical protein
MNPIFLSCAVAAFFGTGCAETDLPEAAFPIGYTPPAEIVPAPLPQEREAPEVAIGVDVGEYADTDPSALTDFRGTLDSHGSWVEDDSYGTVWMPSTQEVGEDFAPYVTGGHWVYDQEYVWVSDYSWGWVPFHYGRWVYTGPRGWGWVPGRAYSGAWVSWRLGYDDMAYVGWAPMPPRWGWRSGRAVALTVFPPTPYVFCGHGAMFHPTVSRYIVTGSRVGLIGQRTRPWVAATPSIGQGGRVMATLRVGGPPPSLLRIPATAVARPAPTDRGIGMARQWARSTTAVSAGGRGPSYGVTRPQVETGRYPTVTLGPTPYMPGPRTWATPQGQRSWATPQAATPHFQGPSAASRTMAVPHVQNAVPKGASPGPMRSPSSHTNARPSAGRRGH